MQLPTVHYNGTSKEELIKQLCHAANSIDTAFDALRQTAPNGRDYYPQGPEAFERAIIQHRDRMARLDAIKEELEAMVVAIDRL